MLKFLIYFLQLVQVSFLTFAACAFGTPQTTDRLSEIKQRGYLEVVFVNNHNPPFIMQNKEGEAIGFNIMLSQEIAKALGVELRLRAATVQDDAVDQLASGQGDLIIASLSITQERAQRINFSIPYFSQREAIIFGQKSFSLLKEREKHESVQSFFDKGMSLGVVKGTSYVKFAKEQFPKAKLVLYDTWTHLEDDLRKGTVGAAFWHEFQANQIISSRPEEALLYKVIFLKGSVDELAIGVPKGNQDFLEWLNIFLKTRKKTTVKCLLDLDKHMMQE